MHYLLISPLLDAGRHDAFHEPVAAATDADKSLRNRVDTREDRLRQTAHVLVADDAQWLPGNTRKELAITFGPATLLSNGRISLVVVWASADAAQAKDSQEIELALSRAMDGFVAQKVGADAAVRWVSRTLLLAGEEAEPVDWLLGQTKQLQLPLNGHGGGTAEPAHLRSAIKVGWANNSVSNFAHYGAADKTTLVSGLVDAQVIWTEAEQLSGDSRDELSAHAKRLGFLEGKSGTGKKPGNLLMSLSLHNVSYDELLMSIQGYRREIAQSSLEMWRYPELMKRISRQITEVTRLESERLSEQRTKYENLVGNVLLVVGLISAAQLILAIIQTAFSGGATGIPGQGNSNGIMAYFRSTSIDLWIWGSVVSTILIFAVLSFLKRRVR